MNKNIAYSRVAGSQSEVPGFDIVGNFAVISGYQDYVFGKDGFINVSLPHKIKYLRIFPYIKSISENYRFIDIGCSAGALGFQLACNNLYNVDFLDHDSEYIDLVNKVIEFGGLNRCKAFCSKVTSFDRSYDVGLAFAIIHWIYSYSEKIGSLRDSIALLKKIAPKVLFIEWVDVNDSSIKAASHITKNEGIITEPYNFEEFKKSLLENYRYLYKLGSTSETRSMWCASEDRVEPSKYLMIYSQLAIFLNRCANYIRRKLLWFSKE